MWLEIKVNTQGVNNCISGLCPVKLNLQKLGPRETHLPFSRRHLEIVFLKVGTLFRAGKRCQVPLEISEEGLECRDLGHYPESLIV